MGANPHGRTHPTLIQIQYLKALKQHIMKHLKLILLLSGTIVMLTSCSKEEDIDPLAAYYGDYLVSESASDDTWTANFSAGENPGEVFITNAVGTGSEDMDVTARIEGGNFSIARQSILKTSFIDGSGLVEGEKIDCRVNVDVGGVFQLHYNIFYEKNN